MLRKEKSQEHVNSIQVFEAVVAIFVGTRRWGLLGQAVMEVATAYVYVGTCTYTVYIYIILCILYIAWFALFC